MAFRRGRLFGTTTWVVRGPAADSEVGGCWEEGGVGLKQKPNKSPAAGGTVLPLSTWISSLSSSVFFFFAPSQLRTFLCVRHDAAEGGDGSAAGVADRAPQGGGLGI